MPSYYESQAPSNSIPATREGVEYVKRKKAEAFANRAPEMAPRFADQLADQVRVNSVPREMIDHEYNRTLRGADLGPLSQGSQRQEANERNKIWELRNAANQNISKFNAFKRNLSDRDLQWQSQQQDSAHQRSMDEAKMKLLADDRDYSRSRDALSDKLAERTEKIAIAKSMINSPDEFTRIRGEEMLDGLMGGGAEIAKPGTTGQVETQPAHGPSWRGRSMVDEARSQFVSPLEGPPDNAAIRPDPYGPPAAAPAANAGMADTPRSIASTKFQMLKDRMKADEERKKQEFDLEIETKRREFAKQDADRAKAQAAEDRARNTVMLQTRLSELDPDDFEQRAEITRQIMQLNATAGAPPISPTAFAPSKRALAKRDFSRRKEDEDFISQELNSGPLASEVQNLKAGIAQTIEDSKSYFGSGMADETAVADAVAKAKMLVSEMEKYEHDPKSVRTVIMNTILPPLSGAKMTPAEKQMRAAITAALSAPAMGTAAPRGRYTQSNATMQPPTDLAQAATNFAQKPYQTVNHRMGQP